MTKESAILLLAVGCKLTHRYFDKNEWVMLEGNKFVFDDGVKISQREFWADRTNKQWDDDWSIFN